MKFAALGMVTILMVAFSGFGVLAQDEAEPGETASEESAAEVSEGSDFEFDLDDGVRESIRELVRNSLRGTEGLSDHIEEVLDSAIGNMERALAEVEAAVNEIDFDEIEVEIDEAIESVSGHDFGFHLDGLEDFGAMLEEIIEAVGDWFDENFEDFLEDWGENVGALFEELGEVFEEIHGDDGEETSSESESVSVETDE